VLVGADAHEHGEPDPELRRVDDRDAALDHPDRLEPLDPPPARVLRQPDPARDLLDRARGVLLELLEDPAVDRVDLDLRSFSPTRCQIASNLGE
jgi:hypothetical protein